jgi:hypothetical protein
VYTLDDLRRRRIAAVLYNRGAATSDFRGLWCFSYSPSTDSACAARGCHENTLAGLTIRGRCTARGGSTSNRTHSLRVRALLR